MISKKKNVSQIGFFSSFDDTLSQKHPLYILANKVDWKSFEDAFQPLYCQDNGRPAKPIRLMVGLLMLKHIRNISDESVVEQWAENNYYQYFCGDTYGVRKDLLNISSLPDRVLEILACRMNVDRKSSVVSKVERHFTIAPNSK